MLRKSSLVIRKKQRRRRSIAGLSFCSNLGPSAQSPLLSDPKLSFQEKGELPTPVRLARPLLSARPRFRLARSYLFRRPSSASPEGLAVIFFFNSRVHV